MNKNGWNFNITVNVRGNLGLLNRFLRVESSTACADTHLKERKEEH